jgi:hypothetical protein
MFYFDPQLTALTAPGVRCCVPASTHLVAPLHAGQGVLENVQLRVEAFEYLQLPIAIKRGRIGRLKLQVC